jgi:hypothetical protein
LSEITLVHHKEFERIKRLLERIQFWFPDYQPKDWTEIPLLAASLGISVENDPRGA